MNGIRWFGRSTVIVSWAASSKEKIRQKTGLLAAPSAGAKNPLSIPGFFSGVLNSSEIAREGSGSRQFRTVVLKYFKQRLNFLIPKGFGKRRTNGVNPAAKALFKKHVGIIERKGRILGEVFP